MPQTTAFEIPCSGDWVSVIFSNFCSKMMRSYFLLALMFWQPLIALEWDLVTARKIAEKGLFESVLADYRPFSITRTDSKRLFPRSFIGRIGRLFARLSLPRWCLSDFDPQRGYRNVYLVPSRYHSLMQKFPRFPAKRK